MKSLIKLMSLGLVSILTASLTTSAVAGTLAEEMKSKAELIARYLVDAEGVNNVSMQPIDAPSLATGLNRIGVELETHLKSHKVTLSSRAKLSIAIKVKFAKKNGGLEFIISLQDRLGDTLVDFTGEFANPRGKTGFDDQGVTKATIDDPDDVQQIISVPVSTHDVNIELDMEKGGKNHELGKAQKHKEIKEAAVDPAGKTFIKNNRVSSSASHKFEIELVRTRSNDDRPAEGSYETVPVEFDPATGLAFAELHPGDNIGVRIYNNSDKRVAADACLDGISSFSLFKEKSVLPFYAITPHSTYLLRGFLKGLDSHKQATYTHFKIVQFEDTVWNKARKAGQTVSTEAFGSIAVHISRELEKAPPKGRGGPGVGEGKTYTEEVKTTKMHVGTIIETIVIQYKKPKG